MPRLVVVVHRTRRRQVRIARPVSFARVAAIFACSALWSLPAAARLSASTRVARRAYAAPLRIGSSIVGDEPYGLQLLLLLLVMRRWGVLLAGGMGAELETLILASHG